MALNEQQLAALDAAAAQAATEAVPWQPVKEGDNFRGEVVQVGWFAIKHNDRCLFTTIRPSQPPVMDGKPITDADLIRVGWVGTVMERSAEQYLPIPTDLVAGQYLGEREQREDMDPYKLTQTVVLDRNGNPKVPRGHDMLATSNWSAIVDAGTGEVVRSATDLGFEADKFALKPGEEPFVPEPKSAK